eukprot:TRINITY_DN68730_c0_g1_i2.p1 TRINITY_DN68730_c0_g1~~TRINITY_DN68730_c0_g1_i2.p1  ORF type:complete len:626 (-),score=78.63 TRINITY_DN68730_c0_g1_i2:217-2094(-)
MLPGPSFSPKHFTKAVSLRGREGRWRDVLHLLRELLSVPAQRVNAACYNACMNALLKCAKWEVSLCLLALMDKQNVEADAITLCTAVAACQRGEQGELARALLKAMQHGSVEPDIIGCNAAISASAKARQWQEASEGLVAVLSDSFVATPNTYNTCADAYALAQHWRLALSLLKFNTQSGIRCDIVGYGSATASLAGGRPVGWKAALHLHAQLQQLALQSNTIAATAVLHVCTSLRQWRSARSMLLALQRSSLEGNTVSHTATLTTVDSETSWSKTVCMLNSMADRQLLPNVVSYASLGKALSESSSRWRDAKHLLAQLSGRHLEANFILFTPVLAVSSHSLAWEQPLDLLACMEDRRLELDVRCHTSAFASEEQATWWQHSARLLAKLRRGCLETDAASWNGCVFATARCTLWEHSTSMLLSLTSLQIEADLLSFTSAVAAWRVSLSLFRACCSSGLRADTMLYSGLADGYSKSLRWSCALELVQMLPGISLAVNAVGYNSVIAGGTPWPEACGVLSTMQDRRLGCDDLTYLAMFDCYAMGYDPSKRHHRSAVCWEATLDLFASTLRLRLGTSDTEALDAATFACELSLGTATSCTAPTHMLLLKGGLDMPMKVLALGSSGRSS